MIKLLKKISRYSSNKIIFNLIYYFSNPWSLNSKSEIYRYEHLNNYLLKKNNKKLYNHILEIGCGEGHHTEFLTLISKKITSIDISSKAISRAKDRNLKNVEFINTLVDKIDRSLKFDLILISEVIYYVKNIDDFLKNIESFNIKYVITIYSKEYHNFINRFKGNDFEKNNLYYNDLINWKIIFKR